jgi:membrane fusion protein, heavy metal efflux system
VGPRVVACAPADASIRPESGQFEQIGRIIDPNQHTALVMGWVDNTAGRLRVGQFITATVDLPPPGKEVAIPVAALVEQGDQQIVLVQPDPREPRFVRRRVAVVRRAGGMVFVQSEPTPAQRQRGIRPLRPGELIVISGAVQLTAALADLQSSAVASK